ncbi:40S ribosomal protein S4 [Nephila pilipes]|uniref:40S ribosomal protein S4 n=1 Tax=Nephila pilipes TaxID=299642 RepID=A0A8X6TYV6_NEPPI|nr:40S ribosomal protein S4 [Nephila pilipes]
MLVPRAYIPFLVTHDARTIRYPDPLVKVNDSVQVDITRGKIMDFVKFEVGNLVMITGGHNLGRFGNITSQERHPGSFDIVHVKDSLGHSFATSGLPKLDVLGLDDEKNSHDVL